MKALSTEIGSDKDLTASLSQNPNPHCKDFTENDVTMRQGMSDLLCLETDQCSLGTSRSFKNNNG